MMYGACVQLRGQLVGVLAFHFCRVGPRIKLWFAGVVAGEFTCRMTLPALSQI